MYGRRWRLWATRWRGREPPLPSGRLCPFRLPQKSTHPPPARAWLCRNTRRPSALSIPQWHLWFCGAWCVVACAQDGTWLPGTGRTELYINNGDKGKLRGRALWLLRNVDEGTAVDLSKVMGQTVEGACSTHRAPLLLKCLEALPNRASVVTVCACCVQSGDPALLSGEIGGKLLDCFSTELTVVYEPTFREQSEWGKAPPEQPIEFKGDLGKFVASIDETVRSMGLGVALTKPRKDVDLDVVARNAISGTVPAPDVLRSLEAVVDDWCNVVNRYGRLEIAVSGARARSPNVRVVRCSRTVRVSS